MSTDRYEPTVTSRVDWSVGQPQHVQAALQRHVLSGATMGTRFSATFYASDLLDLAELQTRLQAAVDQVDRNMSVWKPDSPIGRFNRAPLGQWINVPPDLLSVVQLGIEIGQASAGAFEIGVGHAVRAWGFGPNRLPPDLSAIGSLAADRQATAADGVEIDQSGYRMRRLRDLSLDLNGIAKGFGVDRLADCLEQSGVGRYMVSIDGELRMRGLKPGGSPWSIAIEAPLQDVREAAEVVEITDRALATSGDYRNWVEICGQSHSHNINPRTQRAISEGLASVTVAAPTCAAADAWATALLVMGDVEGPRFAEAHGLPAIFMVREGEAIRTIRVGSL